MAGCSVICAGIWAGSNCIRDLAAGFGLCSEAFSADDHRGTEHQKLGDSVSFLWRSEPAGQPREPACWEKIQDFAREKFLQAGHVAG
jgi:hypothetical protein